VLPSQVKQGLLLDSVALIGIGVLHLQLAIGLGAVLHVIELASLQCLLTDHLHVLSHLLDNSSQLIILLLQLEDLLVFLIHFGPFHLLKISLRHRPPHDGCLLIWGAPVVGHLLLGTFLLKAQSVDGIDIEVLKMINQRVTFHHLLAKLVHGVHILHLGILMLLSRLTLHVVGVVSYQLLPSHIADDFFQV
jgi:hypothetical protein